MSGPQPEPVASDADLQEQREDADGAPEGDGGPGTVLAGGLGDRPEADVLDQAAEVAGTHPRRPGERADDVPEADWLEQAIAEPPDEEEIRA